MSDPVFLTLEEVLEIHRDQIERYGGDDGLRDPGALRSALAQPESTFGGSFLHPDPPAMAAAYLFHLVANHPFVDGNKRVGSVAALVFCALNGLEVACGDDELVAIVLEVAQGRAGKPEVVAFFAKHLKAASGDASS